MGFPLLLQITLVVLLILAGLACSFAAYLSRRGPHWDLVLFIALALILFAGSGFLIDVFTLFER